MFKKCLTVLLALFTLAAVLLPVSAAEATETAAADDMVVAYVSVPDDWENPCIWAWNDDGTNAFDAWPGGELEADAANEGWYYIYLPAFANNVIINANDGTVQTGGELKSAGGSFWVTVTSPEEATITDEKLTTGEAPAYVEKIAIHARVPQAWEQVNLWAWLAPDGTNAFTAWPGEGMKAGDGGWFTANAPAWINSVIINGGAEGIQTADLTIEPQEVWVVVNDDLTAEVAYENPDLSGEMITVRAKVPADWSEPHLWAWLDPDGTNAFSAWPGEPFVQDGDWYTIQVPGWINSIIVNANDGSVQTGDSKDLETGKDIWIVVTDAENYLVDYQEIEEAAVTLAEEPAQDVPEPETAEPEAPAPLPETDVADDDSGSIPVIWVIVGLIVICAVVLLAFAISKRTGKNK